MWLEFRRVLFRSRRFSHVVGFLNSGYASWWSIMRGLQAGKLDFLNPEKAQSFQSNPFTLHHSPNTEKMNHEGLEDHEGVFQAVGFCNSSWRNIKQKRLWPWRETGKHMTHPGNRSSNSFFPSSWTFLFRVKWTHMSRQKRVEFKMVTDRFSAEWRCPNF